MIGIGWSLSPHAYLLTALKNNYKMYLIWSKCLLEIIPADLLDTLFDECRLNTRCPSTFRPSPLTCALSPPVGCYHRSTPPIAIYCYYSARKLTLVECPLGRVSRPRHCNKGVQPVVKAVYGSGYHNKQLPQWDLIPEKNMHCIKMLALCHCDQQKSPLY